MTTPDERLADEVLADETLTVRIEERAEWEQAHQKPAPDGFEEWFYSKSQRRSFALAEAVKRLTAELAEVREELIAAALADGETQAKLTAAIDQLSTERAARVAAEGRLEHAVTLLRQGCGVIVEFGDLNGFRNLSNDELGSMVISTASAIGEFLNGVSPVTDEQRAAVEAIRSARGA